MERQDSNNDAGAEKQCGASSHKVYREWDTQDVSSWLKDQLKLPQYCETFQEIGVDGQIIDHITEVDLQDDFGIKVRLHRVKIIEGIKKLQVKENARKTPPSSEIHAKQSAQNSNNQQHQQRTTMSEHLAAQQHQNQQQQINNQMSSRMVDQSSHNQAAAQSETAAVQNQFSTPAATQSQQTSAYAAHLNQAPFARNNVAHHQMDLNFQGGQMPPPSGNGGNLIQQPGGFAGGNQLAQPQLGQQLSNNEQQVPSQVQLRQGLQPQVNAQPELYHQPHAWGADVNMQQVSLSQPPQQIGGNVAHAQAQQQVIDQQHRGVAQGNAQGRGGNSSAQLNTNMDNGHPPSASQMQQDQRNAALAQQSQQPTVTSSGQQHGQPGSNYAASASQGVVVYPGQADVQMVSDNSQQPPQRQGTIQAAPGAQASHTNQQQVTSQQQQRLHQQQQQQPHAAMYHRGGQSSSVNNANNAAVVDQGQVPPPQIQAFNRQQQHSSNEAAQQHQQLSQHQNSNPSQQPPAQSIAAPQQNSGQQPGSQSNNLGSSGSVPIQQRVDTPPHSNSRSNHGNHGNNSNDGGANGQNIGGHSIFANAAAGQSPSEGMHVFVNSSGGGLAVNGGKFVAASQQYLQELAKNQAASEYQSELQQSDILVLKAVEGQLLNNVYIIGDNGAALGRHSASNDMVISESFVSRRHCEIKYVESNSSSERSPPSSDGDLTNFYLRDIGSTTGTFIMVRQEVALSNNMMFQMGLSEFKVITTSKPTMIELHVFEGPARNRMVPVDESGLTIGRDQQNTFCVQEDSQMSNYHAKISYKPAIGPPGPNQQQRQGFYLTDVGSTNRTWLRLSAEGEQSSLHPLRVGDILKIGSTVFVVESSDIHNLKYMPIINKRAQNGSQFQGGALGAAANQDMDGLGEPMQLAGGANDHHHQRSNEVDDGELILLEEEEELKEAHDHAGHSGAMHHDAQQLHHPGLVGAAAMTDQNDMGGAAQHQQPAGSSTPAGQAEMCKLCYENECDAAFIPCGHVTACIKCAGRCNQCPVCRVPYHDIMKIYRQ